MKKVLHYIELLDRAATELNEALPVNNGISLILTDNVVELMCHNLCEQIFDDDDFWKSLERGRFTRSQRARVLGVHFNEKLRFLKAESRISEEEHQFIKICHEYRNESYHVGATRTDVTFELAWEYHELACDLFVRFDDGIRSSSSDERVSPIAAKHLRQDSVSEWYSLLQLDYGDVVASIKKIKSARRAGLSKALSDERNGTIDEIEAAMRFLVENDPHNRTSDEIVRDVQLWYDLFDDIPIELEDRTEQYRDYISERRKEMRLSWKPKHKNIPLSSWKMRASTLQRMSPIQALPLYENIKRDMSYLATVILDSAARLDKHISEQIDIARGK